MKKMKIGKDTILFEDLKKKWMKNPKFRREYDKLQPEFEIARQLIDARVNKKMTQEEIAKKVGTGQAVISRLEGANASPSLDLLKRVASALGKKLVISFK